MAKRIYKEVMPGMVQPTEFVQMDDGSVGVNNNIRNRVMAPKAKVMQEGYPIMGENIQVNQTGVNRNIMQDFNNGLIGVPGGAALVPGETSSGIRISSRAEEGDLSKTGQRAHIITFDNTDGSAVEENLVLGDGTGFISELLNTSVPSSTLSITSPNFGAGARALMAFRQIAATTAFDYHQLHISQSGDTSFFDDGLLKTVIVDDDFLSVREKVEVFSNQTDSGTFDANIRRIDNFRFQLNTFSGIYLKIPAASKITLTLKVNAVNRTYLMNLSR